MLLPALSRSPPEAIGYSNYNHPFRPQNPYNEGLGLMILTTHFCVIVSLRSVKYDE